MNVSHRELQLLRHAKSDWNAAFNSDISRPLSARGRRAARAMGEWMKQNDITQDIVFTSPSTRTRQTLEIMAKEISFKNIQVIDELYHADLKTFLEILSQVPRQHDRVMLVGHNPGIQDLLLYLGAEDLKEATGKLFPTTAFARLQLPREWDGLPSGAGHLHTLIRPRELLADE